MFRMLPLGTFCQVAYVADRALGDCTSVCCSRLGVNLYMTFATSTSAWGCTPLPTRDQRNELSRTEFAEPLPEPSRTEFAELATEQDRTLFAEPAGRNSNVLMSWSAGRDQPIICRNSKDGLG